MFKDDQVRNPKIYIEQIRNYYWYICSKIPIFWKKLDCRFLFPRLWFSAKNVCGFFSQDKISILIAVPQKKSGFALFHSIFRSLNMNQFLIHWNHSPRCQIRYFLNIDKGIFSNPFGAIIIVANGYSDHFRMKKININVVINLYYLIVPWQHNFDLAWFWLIK